MEFLVRGALDLGERGVFVSFEETEAELATNVASLGFDLDDLVAKKLLAIDYIKVDRSEIEEAGEYDLDGLFVRLGHALDSTGATRVVLDSVEAIFGGFTNEGVLRSELRRLLRWLKDRQVTVLLTGEKGEGALTRYGLEEYVSDCVISLDNRVADQVTTRRLRVVKFRGSSHGTNEYPFLIDEEGISVLPVTSLGLDYPASMERVPTGVAALDDMLEGGGYFRASSILISGTAGTGKSSLAAMFAAACCRRKERVLYFAMEESSAQVARNMNSIGLDLELWQRKRLLKIQAARPTVYGLEMHLAAMHRAIEQHRPSAVVIDPISSLITAGDAHEVKSMLVRLFDYLKMNGITCVVTSLTAGAGLEETSIGISSLIDTWLQVRDIEIAAERTRGLYLVKSRGMGHSNQVREFLITPQGLDLLPVAVGAEGVLTGSARLSLEADARAKTETRRHERERAMRALARRKQIVDAQIDSLRAEFATEEEEARARLAETQDRDNAVAELAARRARVGAGAKDAGRRP
jgi:circadian clock protein KaiC